MFKLWNKIKQYLCEPWWLWALFLINFLGSIYGYYWYAHQLADTPVRYWIFVPDSPLSTTFFAGAVLVLLFKRGNSFLMLLAAASLIKYGLWAVAINIDYALLGGGFSLINAMLTVSHFGMALEGLIYLGMMGYGRRALLGTVFWLILQDYMDYAVGLHPYLFDERQLTAALFWAVFLTVGVTVLMMFSRRREQNKLVRTDIRDFNSTYANRNL